MSLQELVEEYTNVWMNGQQNSPLFSWQYTTQEKKVREAVLDDFLKAIRAFKKDHVKGKKLESFKDKFLENTKDLLKDGLDFTDDQLSVMFSPELLKLTKDFVRKAKQFDPDMPLSEILQACRNVWIMCGIQMIMGVDIELTPSVFAYSMLYPYSDNLIDDPSLSTEYKMNFSNRFYRRLSGECMNAQSNVEEAVFRLILMIEEQFPRSRYPDVFTSLLDIHQAQAKSIQLINTGGFLTDREILQITIEKGGASVVADGCLVAGCIDDNQKHFLFGYGAYLQLLDDIQDVSDDRTSKLMTIFSKTSLNSKLDEVMNKTYWFGKHVLQSLDIFDGFRLDIFKSLIKRSIDLFIIEAIAQNPIDFSGDYIGHIEKFSPFRFLFVQKKRKSFRSYNGFLISTLEEFVIKESLKAEDKIVI